ncbi:MAG: carboxymuconolactone decarboxylase family protein [Halobacteriaceae archaeon]
MVSNATRREIEETLGQVPSFMEDLADPAGDHSWGIFRDLQLGTDTELSAREKALVGVGVASAISCPYCTYFHNEEARLSGATDDELEEAVNLASVTRYFSTVLHGNETDLEDFKTQTDEIVAHIKSQQAAADD